MRGNAHGRAHPGSKGSRSGGTEKTNTEPVSAGVAGLLNLVALDLPSFQASRLGSLTHCSAGGFCSPLCRSPLWPSGPRWLWASRPQRLCLSASESPHPTPVLPSQFPSLVGLRQEQPSQALWDGPSGCTGHSATVIDSHRCTGFKRVSRWWGREALANQGLPQAQAKAMSCPEAPSPLVVLFCFPKPVKQGF